MSRAAALSLGVFASLLLLVLFTRSDRVSVGVRALELPSLEANEVVAVEVGGESAALLRRGEAGWTVEDPVAPGAQFPVDSARVDRLLEAIATLEIAGFVTGRSEKHAELEIDDAKGRRLAVETGSGSRVELVLGRPAKGGGDLLRLSGQDAVFESRTSLSQALQPSVADWRRRKLTDLDAAAIGTLAIQRPGDVELSLTRSDAEAGSQPVWTLVEGPTLPEGFELDTSVAQRAVTGLVQLSAADFVDEDPGESVTGLGEGAARVEARGVGGEVLATVRLGSENESSQSFLRVDGDPQLYLVSKGSVEQLAPNLSELRDLSLLRGELGGVAKLVISTGSARTELAKQAGVWRLVEPASPDDYDFDGSRVEPRLSALTRTKGTRVLDPSEADFREPLRIELSFEDGGERVVIFGAPVDASEGGAAEVAVRSSDGFVYAARAFERGRYEDPLPLFERMAAPPPGAGGLQGLENLPPDVRRQIEEQLRQQGGR